VQKSEIQFYRTAATSHLPTPRPPFLSKQTAQLLIYASECNNNYNNNINNINIDLLTCSTPPHLFVCLFVRLFVCLLHVSFLHGVLVAFLFPVASPASTPSLPISFTTLNFLFNYY